MTTFVAVPMEESLVKPQPKQWTVKKVLACAAITTVAFGAGFATCRWTNSTHSEGVQEYAPMAANHSLVTTTPTNAHHSIA